MLMNRALSLFSFSLYFCYSSHKHSDLDLLFLIQPTLKILVLRLYFFTKGFAILVGNFVQSLFCSHSIMFETNAWQEQRVQKLLVGVSYLGL